MRQFLTRWYVVLILVLTGLFGLGQAKSLSMTTDEGIHIASAYLAITRGDLRFDPEHPFLFKYLTALPLLPLKLNLPEQDQELWDKAQPSFYDSWQEARTWSDSWFYTSQNNADLMIFLARLPGIAMLLLLVWLVYYQTKIWFGERTARWAMFFTASSPTLLAHGSLANTDIPIAALTMLTLVVWWRYFESPNWKTALLSGLVLGIALTVKFSAITLLPAGLIWLVYTAWKHRQKFRTVLLWSGLAVLSAWLVIWAVYQFKSPYYPTESDISYAIAQSASKLGGTAEQIPTFANAAHYILPAPFIKGLAITLAGSIDGRPVFFMGEQHAAGIWYYFPILFLIKTQLAVLFVLAAGLGMLIAKPNFWRRWQPETVLLVSLGGAIVVLAMTSKLNLGIRHIAYLLPLLAIAAGLSMDKLQRIWKSNLFAGIITAAVVFPLIWFYPGLISYTNLLGLPISKTYQLFEDSNLDWGQQTKWIAKRLESDYSGMPVYVNYMWSPYSLPYYGVQSARFNPEAKLEPGVYVVTATQLSDTAYQYFQDQDPDSMIGNHTFFYVQTRP